MPFTTPPSLGAKEALRDVRQGVFWLEQPNRPAPRPAFIGHEDADLVVVGAGFTGLWMAIQAVERHPDWRVVLLEGGRIATGGTGRNGGFVSASLTHGLANGYARWPEELPELLKLGHANLSEIEQFIIKHGIDCDFRRSGEIQVAVAAHQVEELRRHKQLAEQYGESLTFLDRAEVTDQVHSPIFQGGLLDEDGTALVDPARLAWGLAEFAEKQGVRIFESSPVIRLADHGSSVFVTTRGGAIDARRVALATNAYPPLLQRISHYVVPVYDYVLMTEPLSSDQWNALGWNGRQGLADAGNQFHYFRPTTDGRILWGGYDAIYHHGNGFGPRFERDAAAYERLSQHFFETFPQLLETKLRFSHAWGGAIDTCSRFAAFWGTAHRGKTTYVAGYTGLGVGASRFGANTMLDLLEKEETERTRLTMVQTKPLPFPPEPVRSLGIGLTTWSISRADQRAGRRNLWLRLLDRLGLGFDS
jgi:glycine/D-amino acid oxidase-like deaminating enzyme